MVLRLSLLGAGLKALYAEFAKAKLEEVAATGADTVVTPCQQCVRTMLTYAKRNKVLIEMLDITQLVQRALTA